MSMANLVWDKIKRSLGYIVPISETTPQARANELAAIVARREAENEDWMRRNGFVLVLNPMTGRCVEGIDPESEYQFMRKEWDEPAVFRLVDMHPAMNIWGLYYRP